MSRPVKLVAAGLNMEAAWHPSTPRARQLRQVLLEPSLRYRALACPIPVPHNWPGRKAVTAADVRIVLIPEAGLHRAAGIPAGAADRAPLAYCRD